MSALQILTYIIFAYTTVEGLVINILYPNTLPFVFKDVAILLAYLSIMTDTKGAAGSLAKLSAPLGVFAVVTCFFLLLPSQVSFLGEMVAIKQRLFYIPLAWVGYRYVNNEADVFKLLNVMAWTAIPACIFGIYLYFVGPIGLAAIGANYSAYIGSTVGEHGIAFWRVPGTFTSPGQYGGFLLANAMVFVGVLFAPTVPARQRTVTIVALVIALGALMVSGSRSPLLLFMMGCVVMLTVTGRIKGVGVWAGGLYGVLTIGFSFFGDGVEDRVGSIASWEHVERFQTTYFGQLFWPMLMQSPMGFGLGRATLGARHFTDWENIMLVESYFGIIVAETGVIGLAAFLFAIVSVIVAVWKCQPVMRSSPSAVLWYAVILPVLATALLMPISTGVDSAPTNLYFWFFLGVGLKMYDLELERRRGGVSSVAGWQTAPPPAVYPLSYQ